MIALANEGYWLFRYEQALEKAHKAGSEDTRRAYRELARHYLALHAHLSRTAVNDAFKAPAMNSESAGIANAEQEIRSLHAA